MLRVSNHITATLSIITIQLPYRYVVIDKRLQAYFRTNIQFYDVEACSPELATRL